MRFVCKHVPVNTRGNTEESAKTVCKMALIGKSGEQSRVNGSDALSQQFFCFSDSDVFQVAVRCDPFGGGKCPQQSGFAQTCAMADLFQTEMFPIMCPDKPAGFLCDRSEHF